MFLGREMIRAGLLGKLGFLDKQAMRARADDAFKSLGVALQDIDGAGGDDVRRPAPGHRGRRAR